MANVFYYYLVPIGLVVVAVVLGLGLFNMMRGGSANLSQRLMRLRVLARLRPAVGFAAVAIGVAVGGRFGLNLQQRALLRPIGGAVLSALGDDLDADFAFV